MTLDVFRYSPDRREDVAPGLAQFGYGQDEAGIDAYFDGLLDGTHNPDEAVFVVRDDAGSLGMAQIIDRPMCGGAARMINYLMPQDDEAKVVPFGRSLHEAIAPVLAERGIHRQAVMVRSDQHLLTKFVQACGFEITMSHHTMGWEGDGTRVTCPTVDDVTFSVYEGGDAALNEGIARLWEWAFRRDPVEPVLTPDVLETTVRDHDGWFVVAQENGTGRVVGISESGPGNFFSGIAVARSHWGTKVAEGLAAHTMNAFMDRGHNALHSMVRKTNRASLALHERMGWSITGEGNIYASPLPGE